VSLSARIVSLLPLNHLSFITGKLADLRLPSLVAPKILSLAAKALKIDLSESAQDLRQFKSLNALFLRALKAGLRPIGPGLVSPVDGTLRSFGRLSAGKTLLVKGQELDLPKLLGSADYAKRFSAGFFFNLYLSPKDYHHVHYPVSGEIIACTHIPGRLWPVNDWAIKHVDDLFSVNERLVTHIETTSGLVSVVMVGAANVGKMSLSYAEIVTNSRLGAKEPRTIVFTPKKTCSKGERLGSFHLGSSVLLLCEGEITPCPELLPGKVSFGQSLGLLL
jgi:phosphatidylserine decarboxylase